MTTFTELVAAVVVHSSAAAYSHFGVLVEPAQPQTPAVSERVVARTTSRKTAIKIPDSPPTRAKVLKI